MRRFLSCALVLAACKPSPSMSTTAQDLNGMEGMFEFAIDLPWRMEPHITADNHIVYDPVPITIVIDDEDTNHYSEDVTDDHGHLVDFCKLTVSRYDERGTTNTETFYPGDLEWIELTGRDWANSARPTYWPTFEQHLPDPFHTVCHPQSEDCSALHVYDTSEWHAMLKWDPGPMLPGYAQTVELVAYVSAGWGCDSRQIELRNYAHPYWADAPLPRFGDNRWVYGDLHYHSQSTDNEGESGYSYRAAAEAMGAMGIDFTFATDHASNSEQIVDIDGVKNWATSTPRGLRDLNQARWDSALVKLHGGDGANTQVAASWPSGRPRVPQLFLGAEVDVAPEVPIAPPPSLPDDVSPAWNIAYGDAKIAHIGDWVIDGWVTELGPAITSSSVSDIFRPTTDRYGEKEYLVADTQGLNGRDVGRQHVLYIPRFADQPLGLVPSKTGTYGGATRRLVEGNETFTEGVLPEIVRKQGIAFLAHPLALTGGDKGPGMLPYTDYQYTKAFDQEALVGLQIWNEDTRVSSAGCFCNSPLEIACACPDWGDYEVTGYDWVNWWDAGSHMDGWHDGEYRYTPMFDLVNWGGQRLHFDAVEQLHNGAYTWDSMLRWGLDMGRTRSIDWLPPGEPRRMFAAGGSDAHGDFNYRREGYTGPTTKATDTAFAKVRNLVLAGAPQTPCSASQPKCKTGPAPTFSQDQIAGALGQGKFTVTDGPALRIVVDRNRNGIIDDADYPMGSVVELYGDDEPLPLIVGWESTTEFGPIAAIDLYVGVDSDSCRNCPADETRAATYAPPDHGVRRDVGEDQDQYAATPPANHYALDPMATHCTGTPCRMDDGYYREDGLRIIPSTPLAGFKAVTIDVTAFRTAQNGVPTRAYVRAFARTTPPCDVHTETRVGVRFSGACSARYAMTNPVWALLKRWDVGMPCPFTERSLDRDLDGLPDLCDASPDSPNNLGWTRRFGGSTDDTAESVAFDSLGRAYVAGSVFGSGTLEYDQTTTQAFSAIETDAMLVKYDALGKYLQHFQVFGTGGASILDVASDSLGYVYVAGTFTGAAQIGATAWSSADRDGFVAKLRASDLAVQWVKRMGGVGDTRATSIAVTPDGQVAVAGDFTGSLVVVGTIPSEGAGDCYVLRLSTAGLQQAIHRFGGTGDCDATGLAFDSTGRVYVSATYGGALRVGTTTRTTTSRDSVIVRLGSATESYAMLGTTWLGDPATSTDDVIAMDLAITSSGGIAVVGYFHGALAAAVDGGAYTLLGHAAARDGFLVSVAASDGSVSLPPVWRFGGTGDDSLEGVATDPVGHVLVTGWFDSPSVTTPAGTLTKTSYYTDGMAFVTDSTQQVVWQRRFGLAGTNTGKAAAFSGDSRLAIGGVLVRAQVDDLRTVTSAGGNDGFLAVFHTP